MRERVGDRLAKAAAALNTLTPEQRAAVRNTIRERVTAEIREGLDDRLGDQMQERLAERATGFKATAKKGRDLSP
jgi:hypothetical protein